MKWCNARSEKEGLTPVCYTSGDLATVYRTGQAAFVNWSANGYRLPTEAEWEFAARGGVNSHGSVYSGSNNIDEVAWYYNNSSNNSHPVATKMANELGVYDMSGNVREWCWDLYDVYSELAQSDPRGPSGGSASRVNRGSCFVLFDCRITLRFNDYPDRHTYTLGFRCARK